MNLFVYVFNNPVNYTDPSGKWGKKPGSECVPCNERDKLIRQRDFEKQLIQLLETGQSISGKGRVEAKTWCPPPFNTPFITYASDIDIRTCYGKCVYEHEQVHARQCREGKMDTYTNLIEGGEIERKNDIEAYRVSLRCLESYIAQTEN
jgi:hypothetical protein